MITEKMPLIGVTAEKLLEISQVLKTLAHPLRLQIVLQLINEGEKTLSSLKTRLNTEQSLLSHHISDLRKSGIIHTYKKGRNTHCVFIKKSIIKVLKCLNDCPGNEEFKES